MSKYILYFLLCTMKLSSSLMLKINMVLLKRPVCFMGKHRALPFNWSKLRVFILFV